MATRELGSQVPYPPHRYHPYKFINPKKLYIHRLFFLPVDDTEQSVHHITSNADAVVKAQPILKPGKRTQPNNSFNDLSRVKFLKDEQGIPGRSDTSEGLASLLQACTSLKELKQVHDHLLRSGFEQNICLSAQLVSTYATCGAVENARLVFDKLHKPDVFLWNVMIRGYAINGDCETAVVLYYQLQLTGIHRDNLTFPFVLKTCAGLSALQEGKQIHGHIIRSGFESDAYVGSALIDMYAKCGQTNCARQVFDKMSPRDVVSWTAIIAGYAQNENTREALALFRRMQLAKLKPNSITLSSVLHACAQLGALQRGKKIHEYIIRSGLESDVLARTALIHMCAKCGGLEIVRELFDKMPERDAF